VVEGKLEKRLDLERRKERFIFFSTKGGKFPALFMSHNTKIAVLKLKLW